MHYIFDFDGTLISLLNINYDDLKNQIKNKLKYDGILSPMIDKIYELSNDINIIQECFDIIDDYEINAIEKSKINYDILDLYNNSKYKIIVTRNGTKVVNKFFKDNNLIIPDIICSRDNNKYLKPNPRHLNIIFDNFIELNYTNICIVGDSWHDKTLSENINCSFLLVNVINNLS
jgi:phosphoglycolate phosphatase-like HAD superfamily hydrolase